MTYISQLVSGNADYPPGHQWTDRPAYIFPFENMVLWGLGLPLGLAAWAGFAFALYRLVRYREWQHLLIVVWVGITFAYTGQQWVKTMRYFLQIYPFLALLAGYFLITLWDRASRIAHHVSLARISVAVLSLITIGYTLFWAGAFTSIYTRPVSRVTASRWIFQNIPRGAVLANEHWDDPLPLRVDGKDPFGGMYRGLPAQFPGDDGLMNWYDEDTPEKRAQAIRWLNDADYIILSSNRLYGSIPRLPMRYPMTTKYYEWLFDGTLGFDKVAEFTSRPQLFGIEINDDNAEEAFTVYDHPKVLIFKKSERYSPAKTEQLFNSIDLNEVYRFWPREATQAKTALLLKPSDLRAQQSGGTWSEIFHPSDFINQIPVLGWLVLIEALGWLAFPLAFIVFRALADRGYIFAKTLSILLVAWGAWLLASYHILPFSRISIGMVIAILAVISTIIVWRRGRALANFVREQRRLILIEEFVFLAFFVADLLIRYGNPDLWHQWFGGEKPMDFAYLNAIIKSTWMPPYDPWFAGGYINYYYFGQLITATLIKFSGIVPEVAYNLALPMFFAMLGAGAFSVAYNLISGSRLQVQSSTRSYLFALLAAVFVAVIGNLGQMILIGQTLMKIGGGVPGDSPLASAASILAGAWRVIAEGVPFDVPIGWWYWNATRTIPETINEFPFFTFLYADLHAHLMALPFTMLAIGVAINFALQRTNDHRWRITPLAIGQVIIAALVIGGLRAINFADYPTYLLVIASALVIGEWTQRRIINIDFLVSVGWQLGAIYVLSSVLFQPFISNFSTAYLATELWKGERTTLGQYLIVHGIFLFAIATFLALRTFDTPSRRETLSTWLPLIVVALVVIEALLLVLKLQAWMIALPLLVLAGVLVLRPELDAPQRFIALLIAAGLALTMMVEVITYKGDIGRMNTVFKFYLQVWNFFALAAAIGIAFLHRQPKETPSLAPRSSPLHFAWWLIFIVLIGIGLTYTVTATRAKVNDRFVMGSPSGLNGMEFLKTAVYADRDRDMILEYDRQAIDWLRANVPGSPVILEGNAPLYHWASRISIYTGLPTVIGWDWHQKQQRSIIDGSIIDRRQASVTLMYNTRDANTALAEMKRFNVSYIVVGQLEHAFYDAAGFAKFDAMTQAGTLEQVYQNERTTIYRVK
jgi:YYY domain-containing protein